MYGHGYDLSYAVDDLGGAFLCDGHGEDEPPIRVPENLSGRGRTPARLHTDAQSITAKAYHESLHEDDWHDVIVRETAKGVLTLSMHVKRVWRWDTKELQPRRWTLVISRNIAEKTLKYRLNHADAERAPLQQFAYRHAKSELGMPDYQVLIFLNLPLLR